VSTYDEERFKQECYHRSPLTKNQEYRVDPSTAIGVEQLEEEDLWEQCPEK
jgi:hypothetical protein